MARIHIGLNTEFSRSSDKPFEWAVQKAAEMGYKYIEPMVHFGRELMSEAGYFHTVSMFDDPYRIKDACDKAGLTISGLQAHGPLGRPDVHGEYIKLAIRVAAEIGAPVVNTDEGIKAKWTTEEEDFVLIKYTLQEAAFIAERRGVKIGLEPHAQYSRHPDGLDRIYTGRMSSGMKALNCSVLATRLRCDSAAPLDRPVVPPVYCRKIRSSPVTSTGLKSSLAPSTSASASVTEPASRASTGPQNIPSPQAAPTPPGGAATRPSPASETVEAALHAWVSAWKSKDAAAYLSHYAPDFQPARGLSREEWIEQRRQRLAKPGDIDISIADIDIATNDDKAWIAPKSSR